MGSPPRRPRDGDCAARQQAIARVFWWGACLSDVAARAETRPPPGSMGKTRARREDSDDEGPETVTLATVRSLPCTTVCRRRECARVCSRATARDDHSRARSKLRSDGRRRRSSGNCVCAPLEAAVPAPVSRFCAVSSLTIWMSCFAYRSAKQTDKARVAVAAARQQQRQRQQPGPGETRRAGRAAAAPETAAHVLEPLSEDVLAAFAERQRCGRPPPCGRLCLRLPFRSGN